MWIKRIKKYGTSAVLVLTVEELRIRGWKVGDNIDISDIIKINGKKDK